MTFYRRTERAGEVEIDTGSFLVADEGSGQPPAGGGGVSVPMPDIAAISAPAPAVVEMAALTTANPTMSFSLPAGAPVSGISSRLGAVSTNPSNTGSGSPGEGAGDGGGTGGGIGGGNGSGNGVGQGDGGVGEGKSKRVKRIGRIPIDAEKLGVVLDVSTSMSPHSGASKRQAMRYKNAVVKTLNGCSLAQTKAIFDNLSEQGVDAIYWLCDLQDGQTEEALDALEKMLTDFNIKLYVSSWDRPPSPRLLGIVQNSGGAVEVKGKLLTAE